MRFKPKAGGFSSPVKAGGGGGCEAAAGWEVRPGGMFVQRRTSDYDKSSKNVKVRVKYGSSYHEMTLSSLANFAGVKNGSEIVVIEDGVSRERRRRVETRGDEEIEKASREISAVRFEVDNLAKQVASIEMEINGGYKVVDTYLSNLIELLMTQLIKLDGIAADGDVKMQRRVQVKRVQKYIESLDLLKIRNSGLEKMALQKERFIGRRMNPGPAIVTTKWEAL